MPRPLQLIQSFLNYLKYQKRYSQHTILAYESDLTAFFDFVQVQFNESEVKAFVPAYIKTWLAGLKEHKISTKTINRKISSLKTFFKFLLREQLLTADPMETIISPKVSKRLPQYVEKADINTLFTNIVFPDTWAGKTDKLILQLLYNTGMRQGELLGLKDNSIDAGNGTLKVTGKGNKERIIPLNNHLLNDIRAYVNQKNKLPDADGIFLLVNQRGKKLYPKYVYLAVKKYLDLVTTISRKSPHVMRHTFATHLSNNGAQLNAIKELLGHSSLAATQIYTHNTIEKLKDIHRKAHPKS
ncbi:MAG: tyrosine-type recombinase/integrase [Ferruginibacter sp.]